MGDSSEYDKKKKQDKNIHQDNWKSEQLQIRI